MGALDGLRVVDLSRVLGGPLATQYLADHGADVIKIEPPRGDETRDLGPPFRDDGTAAYFVGVNRNKRSMALDLRKTPARAVVLRLLEDADVLVENFRSGTMERWRLGYETLAETFPRLIYCRISGFGDDGPYGGAPAYDAIAQALSGLMSVNGRAEDGGMRIGVALVDMTTGMNAAIAILAAIHERSRSGRGQRVEATLYDTALALQQPHLSNYLMSGEPHERRGNAHANVVPYDRFETRDGPLFIGVVNDRQFEGLCEELDIGGDQRFLSNEGRVIHRDALDRVLRPRIAERGQAELTAALTERGVPAAPVLDLPTAASHPHTAHRGLIAECDGDRFARSPIRFSRTPGRVHCGAPRFGQNGREILTELGYDEATIATLLEETKQS